MSSSSHRNGDSPEDHPDPPSPTLSPPDEPPSTSSPAAAPSTGVGALGGSGRTRFYDALRRIGFPHLLSRSPSAPSIPAAADTQDSDEPRTTSEQHATSSSTAEDQIMADPSPSGTPAPPDTQAEASSASSAAAPGAPEPPTESGAAPPPQREPHGPLPGQPFFGLDIALDAAGGPPPTRDEMEALMRSLFGPDVTLPPLSTGPTLAGGLGLPVIQAIPPPGMFTQFMPPGVAPMPGLASFPGPLAAQSADSNLPPASSGNSPTSAASAPPTSEEGDQARAEDAPAADAPHRPPAPGGLGALINQFIASLVQQHRAANNGHMPAFMPVVITFSFGTPGQGLGLNDDKVPDPERAKELLGALSRPSTELLHRLDHALKAEEEDAGVEESERGGAQCSVCMSSLIPESDAQADEDEQVVSLPCSHCFHVGCLEPWLRTSTHCPTCRFDLDPLSTTLRPHRQTPGRAPPGAPSPSDAGAIPNATGANAQGRGHPYSRSSSRPGTPSSTRPSPAPERKYVLPSGRQTLLERVVHLEMAHHIRCSDPLCSHADPDLPSPPRRTVPLLAADQPGQQDDGFLWLACEHRFHPDCLRVASRVRGDREIVDERGRRLVQCDVKGCRGEGWIEKDDWENADDGGTEDQAVEDSHHAASPSPASAMEVDTA